jgi:SWIM zinc finger
MVWTAEQILALAPDAGSVKAGKGLATPRPWSALGQDGQAAWGECQGSGASPYRTTIDLSEPAFHCTCPSRKFPCKHALGLFLLLESQPSLFTQKAPPAWATEWLASRAQRAQQRAEKAERATPERADRGPADPAAQGRRAAERQAKVTAGLEELALWLRDRVRRGLAALQGEPYSAWENPAARLVDAQAPGLARQLREMASIPASGDGWQERLLARFGALHLLVEGFRRLETLPPETQADIRALIGWTQSQEELLAEPGVRDRWAVLGQRVEVEDRLRVQRTWLWGQQSGRAALILTAAHVSQPLETSLLPGTWLEADLVFYPSAAPLRALVKTRHAPPAPLDTMPGYPSAAAAAEAYAAALARHPWMESFPTALPSVLPAGPEGGWVVRDDAGARLPLSPRFERGWQLLALSGGHPLGLFGEWDGDYLLPLGAWADGRFHALARARE